MPDDIIYLTKDFVPVDKDDPRMAMVKVRQPDGKIVFGLPVEPTKNQLFVQGGKGSGYKGHAGRPGKVGGSSAVYHGTTIKGMKSILKTGLLTSYDKEKWRKLIFVTDSLEQAKIFGMGEKQRGQYAILYIDTGKVPGRITGFGGQLTTDIDIPPEAIIKVEIFKFDNVEDPVGSHALVDTIIRNSKVVYFAIRLDGENQLFIQGGPGSGYEGHAGRPGKVGGSVPETGKKNGNTPWQRGDSSEGLSDQPPTRDILDRTQAVFRETTDGKVSEYMYKQMHGNKPGDPYAKMSPGQKLSNLRKIKSGLEEIALRDKEAFLVAREWQIADSFGYQSFGEIPEYVTVYRGDSSGAPLPKMTNVTYKREVAEGFGKVHEYQIRKEDIDWVFHASSFDEGEIFIFDTSNLRPLEKNARLFRFGGPGSGDFGHSGRPGLVGGSRKGEGMNDPHYENDEAINDPRILKKLRVPKKMYHVTDRKNLDSIQKKGLTVSGVVRAGDQEITRGIYLAATPGEILEQVEQGYGELNFEDPVVLEIDTNKLNLRLDPEYYPGDISPEEYISEINQRATLWAMYSRNPIPSNAIRVYRKQ